jgi:hypothetical protein
MTALKAHGSHTNATNNVFCLTSGEPLTKATFVSELKTVLFPVFGSAIKDLSGKSFRAGVPSALASRPDLACSDEIGAWGRWNSDAYKAYTRLKIEARRKVFEKILSIILPPHLP